MRTWICLGLVIFAAWASPLRAQPAAVEGWEEVSMPDTRRGLVLQPQLQGIHGKLLMFWAGTWEKAPTPELCFSSREEGDNTWRDTRAPYFGTDLGRVRRVAVATARDQMGVIFQRQPTQGGGAMEVLMAISNDRGWSLGAPVLLDSYVADGSLGTWLALGARQGTKRPEFAAAWVAEDDTVRAASIDTSSQFRPQAKAVGHLKQGASVVASAGSGREGFFVVWAESAGLKTVRIMPLTGGAQEPMSLVGGNYLNNFSMCSHYKGAAHVVAIDESGAAQLLVEDGDKFVKKSQTKLNLRGRKMQNRSCLDGDKTIHLAILNGDKKSDIYYVSCKDGKWSEPQLVLELDPSIPVTGFDIAATDNYVWVIASQGQRGYLRRHKLGD